MLFLQWKNIAKQSPGIGYILGDEGSGVTWEKGGNHTSTTLLMRSCVIASTWKYNTNRVEIIENVYVPARQPIPGVVKPLFLAENRGHYMIENIIEDGLNDFFHPLQVQRGLETAGEFRG